MKQNNFTKRIACVFGLGLLCGCTPVQRSGDLMIQDVPGADQPRLDELWSVCEGVLRKHGFRLDRMDRRAGILTTHPETSQHFFEIWRKDVATAYDFWEASLHTIRRSVEIQTEPDAAKGETRLTVTVKRERFSAPDRQFNNSIGALQFYRNTLPSLETGAKLTAADDEWIEDGRDLAMEKRLLEMIVARAG